jgi:hypothetical protein
MTEGKHKRNIEGKFFKKLKSGGVTEKDYATNAFSIGKMLALIAFIFQKQLIRRFSQEYNKKLVA